MRIPHNTSIISDATLLKQGHCCMSNVNKDRFRQFSPIEPTELPIHKINAGRYCQRFFQSKTQQLLILIHIYFAKSALFPLIMTEKHMLPRHCLGIATSWHNSLLSKLRLWATPDFRMSAKIACLFWLIFYL